MARRKVYNRTIMFFGSVTENNICKIIDQIDAILEEDPNDKEPIKIILSSEGGDVYEGFGLIGYMESVPVKFHIHCVGKIMSMALPIAVAGDLVTASPYCTFMYHEISNSISSQEKVQYFKQETKECERLQKMYDEYIVNHTKLDIAFLDDIKNRRAEFYFSPKEAIKYGIISKIV